MPVPGQARDDGSVVRQAHLPEQRRRGIQNVKQSLDSGFRRNDKELTFYEFIKKEIAH